MTIDCPVFLRGACVPVLHAMKIVLTYEQARSGIAALCLATLVAFQNHSFPNFDLRFWSSVSRGMFAIVTINLLIWHVEIIIRCDLQGRRTHTFVSTHAYAGSKLLFTALTLRKTSSPHHVALWLHSPLLSFTEACLNLSYIYATMRLFQSCRRTMTRNLLSRLIYGPCA